MKITFKSYRELLLFTALSAFPLGALMVFLVVALISAITGRIACLDFNHYGEAWIDVAFLLIATLFSLFIVLRSGEVTK